LISTNVHIKKRKTGPVREAATWLEHRDINAVMLATSLASGCFLAV